jgi:DNA-directed RNA polymerase specialized sigma24 family protein
VELTTSSTRLTRSAKCPCDGSSGLARRAAQVTGRPVLSPWGDSDSEMPVTRIRVPRVSGGWHATRRSGDDDAARSQESHRAAGVSAGAPSAATAMATGSLRRDRPGEDADQAVTALYHAHCHSLARIAALLIGDIMEAEEVVQDAYVAMHRAGRRMPDGNKALDCLRRAVVSGARSQKVSLPGELRIPETPLVAVLSGLPARQREAPVLKYYANWPEPQIATAMGVSRHALKAHLRQGMSALQACLAPDRGWCI